MFKSKKWIFVLFFVIALPFLIINLSFLTKPQYSNDGKFILEHQDSIKKEIMASSSKRSPREPRYRTGDRGSPLGGHSLRPGDSRPAASASSVPGGFGHFPGRPRHYEIGRASCRERV